MGLRDREWLCASVKLPDTSQAATARQILVKGWSVRKKSMGRGLGLSGNIVVIAGLPALAP